MSPYSREHHTAVVAPVSAVSPVIEEFGGGKKDDVSGAGLPPYHHKYSESGKPAAGYTNGLSLLRRLFRWWLARFGQKPLAKKGTLSYTTSCYFARDYRILSHKKTLSFTLRALYGTET
ncbi:Hypothetical protein CINCED_3A001677 [Cinara cedri]|uniref:Uncharacterized protein n=1 Tax=Cinara cedri TaxID=506608 RepID=A0A5E4M4U8_9HEMI|nr:Hypothetical protein CINCED_3A001677 [Cinara cedri]